jgi:PEP-CTERM motif
MSALRGASLTAKASCRPIVGRFGVLAAAALVAFQAVPAAAQTSILFIGNSFTYGELTPSVMNYKPGTVTDLVGTNIGGVPSLFKQMTVDRGLNYNVFLETQPGSNLDFHYINRLALINRPWDMVVMHGQSNLDFGAPNNPAKLSTYTGILGSVFQAQNPNVDISLTATWSRADLTYQPACTSANPPSPWCGGSILQMGIDVQKGYDVAKANNPSFVDRVNPVGLAWNNAILAGFADPNPYDGITAGQIKLWASDNYHASAFGYYLHALVDFGEITGQDPTVLGFDTVAHDLGFTEQQARAMQGFASAAITAAVPEPETWLLLAAGGGMLGWVSRRRRRSANA